MTQLEFNAMIRRLSAAKPFKVPSEMPVLKTAYGLTVEAIETTFHQRGVALTRLRRITGRLPIDITALKLVPRADLLAGQVRIA